MWLADTGQVSACRLPWSGAIAFSTHVNTLPAGVRVETCKKYLRHALVGLTHCYGLRPFLEL